MTFSEAEIGIANPVALSCKPCVLLWAMDLSVLYICHLSLRTGQNSKDGQYLESLLRLKE